MSMDKMIPLMLGGIKDTLYMTTVSTLFAYLLGLPIAILLVLTAPSGLKPQKLVYRLLDMIVNIFRSIPFLILMILVIPVTRAIAGKAYGSARPFPAARFWDTARCPARLAAAAWVRLPSVTATTAIRRMCSLSPSRC